MDSKAEYGTVNIATEKMTGLFLWIQIHYQYNGKTIYENVGADTFFVEKLSPVLQQWLNQLFISIFNILGAKIMFHIVANFAATIKAEWQT